MSRSASTPALVMAMVAVVALLFLAPTSSEGAEIRHAASVPMQLTEWQRTLRFDRFDPSLGELISVDIAGTLRIEGTIEAENKAPSAESVVLSLRSAVTASGPGFGGQLAEAVTDEVKVELEPFDGAVDFVGPSAVRLAGLTASAPIGVSIVDPAGLAQFVGQGRIALDASTLTGFGAAGGGGNTAVVVRNRAGLDVEVIYSYLAPAIDIEKATNGVDADEPPGPAIAPGDPVAWTYVVTNTGEVDLTDVTVTDDQGVDVSCPAGALAVGESMSCTGSGEAMAGSYVNLSTVVGRTPSGGVVTDSDPSHYNGLVPAPTAPPPATTPEPTPPGVEPPPEEPSPTPDEPTPTSTPTATVEGGEPDEPETTPTPATIIGSEPPQQPPSPPVADSNPGQPGNLPFTGSRSVLVFLAGVALLGGGLGLVIVARTRAQPTT